MAVRKTKEGLDLKRWFKEDWKTPRGKEEYSGSDRTFRPTKRISKDTPATWSELSKGEKAAAAKEKKEKGRVSRYKAKKKAMEGMKVMKKGSKVKRIKSQMEGDKMNMPAFEAKSKSRSAADKMYADKASGSGLESKLYQDSDGNYIRRSVDSSPAYRKGGRTQRMPKMKMGVHKSREGGLTAKGVAAYRRANPGSKLKTAVTTEPSKLKPGSKAAKRRKSFCARMSGMPGPMKKPNGKPTRKALALRKWNC